MGTHPIFESDFDCLTVNIGIMDSPQIEKVVAFGGKIYTCLNEFDNGNKDAFNVIIDQLADPLLDYKVLMKLLKEIESCAPLITKDHGKIFKTLLSLAFDDFPDLVLECWIRSVLSVITSQPVHLRQALSSMVMCFKCKSYYHLIDSEVKNTRTPIG